ncbi:MAG: TylF/MycF/NovP-related O-methyltransferase [Mariniblastus sp.]
MRKIRKARNSQPVQLGPIEKLRNQIPDATDSQLEIIHSVHGLTMTSPERILAVCNAVEYLSNNNIAGDFVECGVWRGGSMAAAAKTLAHIDVQDRQLWMYDTYEGMSEPTEQDVDYLGHTAENLMSEQDREDAMSVWCCSALEQVKQTMAATGYDTGRIQFVKGKVEDTLPNTTPEKIALLRLDTDWYESTRCELEHLFPKLVPGGVLIVDDYGHWEGCRRAVDEYFEKNNIPMLLNRIDYTGRIGIHCPGSN